MGVRTQPLALTEKRALFEPDALAVGLLAAVSVALLFASRSAAVPSAERSELSCGPCEARADGREQVRVLAQLRDAEGKPVRGVQVLIGAAFVESDESGAASLTFSSATADAQRIEARLSDGASLGAITVGFSAGALPRFEPLTRIR